MIPGYLLPPQYVLPAGQVAAPPAAPPAVAASPTVVTSDSMGHVVDQTGKVLTDASGMPLKFQRTYHMRGFVGFLTIAAAVGIPAFIGSYFGARKAAK